MKERNAFVKLAPVDFVNGEATPIELPGSDEQNILAIVAEGDCTIKIKAGDGVQSGLVDLEQELAEGLHLIKLDSGRYKQMTGENAGKIVVTCNGNASYAMIGIY